VADTGNSVVCKVDEATGLMAVVAGSFDDTDRPPSATPRPARSVRLDRPKGLALDTAGRRLFIANSYREPRDPNDADFGGNVLVLDFNEPDDPDDDTVAVLVPNVKVEVNARIEQPAALAYHRFASGEETLFILDRGRLDASADASKPRPALYRVDVGSLAGDIEVGDVDPVSLGMESIGFVCDPGDPNDPADDFITSFRKTTCDPGDLNSRCAPWIPRFLEDIQPVDLPDDGLGLLVSLDAMDQFIEAGDAGVDTLGFEVNCHDGNGLDAASPDCTRPMRSVLLLLRFDDLGMQNENGTLTLLQGFKRFALEGVTPRCNCGNPATDSLIDVADLVLGPISSTADGRLVFTVDACRGDVTFAAFDESWMLLRTGRVAGADPATARSFDGAPPLDTAFGRPQGLAVDELQNLTIVDTLNNRVRRTYVGDQVR
jgi:hypothetical protein